MPRPPADARKQHAPRPLSEAGISPGERAGLVPRRDVLSMSGMANDPSQKQGWAEASRPASPGGDKEPKCRDISMRAMLWHDHARL